MPTKTVRVYGSPTSSTINVFEETNPVIVQTPPSTVKVLVGSEGPPGPAGAPGAPGTPGEGVAVKGTVATSANLPTTGNTVGDLWITADTGHGHVWQTNSTWLDVGPIQGPPGAGTMSDYLGTFTPPVGTGTSTLTLTAPASWPAIGMNVFVSDHATPPVLIGSYVIKAISGNVLTLANLP